MRVELNLNLKLTILRRAAKTNVVNSLINRPAIIRNLLSPLATDVPRCMRREIQQFVVTKFRYECDRREMIGGTC